MSDDRIVISADDLGVEPEPPAPQSLPPITPPAPRAVIAFDESSTQPPPPTAGTSVSDKPAPPPAPTVLGGTTAPAPGGREPATFGVRVGAELLDGVIQLVPVLLVYVGAIAAAVLLQPVAAILIFIVGILVISHVLITAPMARSGARNGQTYGMQIVGIRKVREDGEPFAPGFALFWWWVPGLVFSITLVGYFVNALWPLFHPQQRSLRDLMTKTETLMVPASSRPG